MFSDKFINEINALEAFVNSFDYSQLRKEEYKSYANAEDEDAVFYGATKESIVQLCSFFSTRLLNSADQEITKEFRNLKNIPQRNDISEEMKEEVRRLALIICDFKNKIQEVESQFYINDEYRDKGKLRETSEWVVYFHFTVEQHLDKNENKDISKRDYRKVPQGIKELGEGVYEWLKRYSPDDAPNFTTLASRDTLDNDKSNKNKRVRTLSFLTERKQDEGKDNKKNDKDDDQGNNNIVVKRLKLSN